MNAVARLAAAVSAPRFQRADVADHTIGSGVRAARAITVDAPLGPLGRKVLSVMHGMAAASGVCLGTYAEIADRSGTSSKSVQRAVKQIVRLGFAAVRYVQRGGDLTPGVKAMSPRSVITLKELPLVDTHGLNGSNMLAHDPRLALKWGERAVLEMLLIHMDHTGKTFVGAEHIASTLRMHVRTVRRHLVTLMNEGHTTHRPGEMGASGYRLVNRWVHPRPGSSRRRLAKEQEAQANGGQSVQGGGTGCPPKEIHQADPLCGQLTFAFMTQKAAPRVDPVAAAVLETHERVCKTHKAIDGDGAVELVKAMLSEGLTPRDLGKAFSGVMTMAYRRERLVRREIGAVLQTKAQAISFIKRVDPERAEQIEKNAPAPPTKSELERISQDVRRFCASKRPDFSARER